MASSAHLSFYNAKQARKFFSPARSILINNIVYYLYVCFQQFYVSSFRSNCYILCCSRKQNRFSGTYFQFITFIVFYLHAPSIQMKITNESSSEIITADFFGHIIHGSSEVRTSHKFYRLIFQRFVFGTIIIPTLRN